MAQASDNLVAPLLELSRFEDRNTDDSVNKNAESIWVNLQPNERNRTANAKRDAETAEREMKRIQLKMEKLNSTREENRERMARDASSEEKMSSTNRREAENCRRKWMPNTTTSVIGRSFSEKFKRTVPRRQREDADRWCAPQR